MKQQVQTLRLIVGAARADDRNQKIAPEFVPQIEQANAHLQMMSGRAVVDALLICIRNGFNLDLDLQTHTRIDSEESKRPGRR